MASLLFLSSGFGQSLATYDPGSEQEILRRVNQERVQRGLQRLQLDERLTQAARQHSELMAERHTLSHQFRGEKELDVRLGATGIRFNRSGENVAVDSGGPDAAHEGLMHSPPHRANILSPDYNAIGIGVVKIDSLIYVTQDFANRLPETSVVDAETQISRQFNDLRKSAGQRTLPVIENSHLRGLACDMAKHDSLDPKKAASLPNVARTVTFTISDLTQMPTYLQQLRTVPASGFSVGACFATSHTYSNPTYWVIVVTYF